MPRSFKELSTEPGTPLRVQAPRFDELDTLRDWRSRKYRSGFKVESSEVDEAIAIATPFLEKVAEWFASHHATLLKQAAGQSKG